MANEVVPETSWGPSSFGLADKRTAQVQIKYATEQLHCPVWGMSPSSTADDTGGYGDLRRRGADVPLPRCRRDREPTRTCGLSQCHGCATEDVVTPHASFIALDVAPQQAYANIADGCAAATRASTASTASSTRSTRPPAPSVTATWCSTSR